MTHGSLFSGIGGFDLAARWAGIETKWQVETDDFCNKVLENYFPNAKRYRDIKETTELERVDVISGGFPCQPFSVAGKRKGKDDDRYLWEEMLRIITEVKPTYVIGENVANLWNMGFENLLVDLENEGYEVESFIIPACSVNAPHRRDRIWVVAYTEGKHRRDFTKDSGNGRERRSREVFDEGNCNVTNPNIKRLERSNKRNEGWQEGLEKQASRGIWEKDWLEVATEFCRVDARIPNRLDRLKSLGNAIVPQIAYILFECIKQIEEDRGSTIYY